MLNYLGYIAGTVIIPYIIGKIFRLKGRENPLFNNTDESTKITLHCAVQTSIIDNIKASIIEELYFRLIPYIICSYLFADRNLRIIVFMLISGPYFGSLHISQVQDLKLRYKLYHFTYVMIGGVILGKAFYETMERTNISYAYLIGVGLHLLHNLMCDGLYYIEKN